MKIGQCEFCKAYITNLEVRYCWRIENQHRQTSATLPQRSSGNLAEDIELIKADKMDHEARWPSASEFDSSTQESILSSIHQRSDCEETAAAKMSSQYEVSNYNQYNPKIPDFQFPGKPSVDENVSKSLNLKQTSEESEPFRNPNLQYSDASNPEPLVNNPMPLFDQCVLPGFQQTFGQRNAVMNKMSEHNNAVSQMECPGILHTNEVSSHFPSTYYNFDPSEHILTNETWKYSGMSLETPILNIQNVLYSTDNTIHSTNFMEQKETFPFKTSTCDDPLENLPFGTNSLYRNQEENISEISNPYNIADYISLPSTSFSFSVENQASRVSNIDAIKFKEDDGDRENKQWTDFNYGAAENISYPSYATQIEQHNFGGGKKGSSTDVRAWEYSSLVTCSSEMRKNSKISTPITTNESNATDKNRPEDMIFGRNVISSEDLDTPFGNTKKQLYKCGKDGKAFSPPIDDLEFRDRSPTAAIPYKCKFCDKTYACNYSLSEHLLTHTGNKPYQCNKCDKCFTYRFQLCEHNIHTGERPYSCSQCDKSFANKRTLTKHLHIHSSKKLYSCTKCGKCFVYYSELNRHIRTHSGEKPYACNKCSKRYACNNYLKHHMLKHAGEEKIKCYSCGAEFSSEELLEAHKCRMGK
ncbi:hypothetical protein CDAR_536251 [Caerostris darwini]|uniref:C2H2-type domain-containing protein n=1 Tax=Caerostris darwini TaxID=1538125 RepID=A0AAV4T3L3_9ARAC|nr:hypothetical protein CDAR_536251 [Caerostris darwini]